MKPVVSKLPLAVALAGLFSLSLHVASLSLEPTTAASSRRDFLGKAAIAGGSAASGLLTALHPSTASAVSPSDQTICVTGANGYIGLHCVANLLDNGYKVKAALRAVSESKTKYLQKIAAERGASDKLTFTSIDLLDVGSMVEAGRGCDAMLHLASPFTLKTGGGDPIKTIVEPAIAGATNAVEAANVLGLQRVVACGSIFGMVGSGSEKGFDHVYGENDVNGFNTPKGCSYAYSKMAAQEKSISLAAQNGVDLVTLNVGQVCGPAISPEQNNPSWEPFKLLATPPPGGAVLSCCVPGLCDVRDVAQAHVAALGLPASKQRPRRYSVASQKASPTYVDIAKIYAEVLPERKLPEIVEALPPKVQKLVIKGIGLGDKSLGELLEGVTIPEGKTLLVDTNPMLRDLVPRPRTVKQTLKDWFDNQSEYGHIV
ncbi:hypothetical protein ACHAWF_018565 [Thalassiosira exigua]